MTAPSSERVVPNRTAHRGSLLEVLLVFLRLGVTSFGGPVAHLGYFRAEFVERRKWLDEAAYVDIVALCQFLPGPASSQVGITLGTLRAGLPGALAAWFGFTMPSAVAMVAFGYGVAELGDISHVPWLHGLKIVAVAVVAQAVWGMARTLCPDRERATLAVGGGACAGRAFGRRSDRRHRRRRPDRLAVVCGGDPPIRARHLRCISRGRWRSVRWCCSLRFSSDCRPSRQQAPTTLQR